MTATAAEMLKAMEKHPVPKSVKDLLAEAGTKVHTWGQVDQHLQQELHHMKKEGGGKTLVTRLENVSRILDKLRKYYEASTALRTLME